MYTLYWATTFQIAPYSDLNFFTCYSFSEKQIINEVTTVSIILNTTSVILDTALVNEPHVDSSNGCLDCAKIIRPKEAPITSKDVYKVLKSLYTLL